MIRSVLARGVASGLMDLRRTIIWNSGSRGVRSSAVGSHDYFKGIIRYRVQGLSLLTAPRTNVVLKPVKVQT